MNTVRAWLLLKLAGEDSVVINTTVNLYESGAAPETVCVVYRGQKYETTIGAPVLEVQEGSLVAGCTFRRLPGMADRMLNAS